MDAALSCTHARLYNGLRAIVKQNRTWAGACSGASGRLDRMPGIAVVVAAVPSVRAGCRGLSSEALAERVEADATAPTCPITRSSSPVNRTGSPRSDASLSGGLSRLGLASLVSGSHAPGSACFGCFPGWEMKGDVRAEGGARATAGIRGMSGLGCTTT